MSIPSHPRSLPACCRCMPAMVLMVAVLLFASCSKEEGVYPDLVTEFADISTDHTGRLCDMLTDNGVRYAITNTNIRPHRPDTVYRAVVGFVPEASAASAPAGAHVYSLIGACVLGDSTAIVRHDPTGIESMWAAGPYINMQLTPKTQGGLQHWGYAVDSLKAAGADGRFHSCHYLSVHHVQGNDQQIYSATVYCSIHVHDVPGCMVGDTITVNVSTFSGRRGWRFCVR